MKIAFYNLILRGLAIAGRFVVLIGIGRYLSETDLGIYGLFYSTIVLSIYFIGLDFYTFSTREIIAAKGTDRLTFIRNQFAFHLYSYLIILPILLPVFFYDILPVRYMLWFYIVLIFNHLSQEFIRIFIALSRSIFANFISFVHSGLWVFVLAVFWILDFGFLINLETILIFWGAASVTAFLVALAYLKFALKEPLPGTKVNWTWIRQGLFTAMPFFVGSVCYKIIEHSNRYFIDFFQGRDLVGIFTFYAGIANIVSVLVNTAIIIIAYPKLYELFISRNWEQYNIEKRKFFRNVLLMSVASGLILLLMIDPLIALIGKSDTFQPNLSSFYLLVLANVILNISLIPHFILYVQKKDLAIMFSTLAGMLLNVVLNYFLIKSNSIDGAAVSMIGSFLIIAIVKFYFVLTSPIPAASAGN